MKPNLYIDTTLGLGYLDYLNVSDEVKRIVESSKMSEIEQCYLLKIMLAKKGYGDYSHNRKVYDYRDTYILNEYIRNYTGPDQSEYSLLGEENAINIYSIIVKSMWNDIIDPNKIRRNIRIKHLIRYKLKTKKSMVWNIMKNHINLKKKCNGCVCV